MFDDSEMIFSVCAFFNKVCERSLSGSGAGPNATSAAQFVRAEMLPSGYLIRPCDGGGSIIHIVDHINLEVRKIIAKSLSLCTHSSTSN